MKKAIICIKILISIILIWFLVHTSRLDFTLLLNLLYSKTLLLIAALLSFITIGISAWRWQQLNNAQHIHLSYWQTLLPTYLGIVFNNLLPGGVGGDFFRFYILNKYTNAKKSAVMLSILFDRITGLLGIFLIVTPLAFFYLQNNNNFTFYFLVASICISFFIFLILGISKILPLKTGIGSWLNNRFENRKWLNPLLSILDAMRIYRNSKKTIGKCLIASVFIQIFIALTCMLIAKIMDFPSIAFTDYLIAIAVTQIVNLIPIAPGGFGVGEMAFANVLLLLNPGTSASYATIFVAFRIIGLLTYLPGLSIFLFEGHKNYLSNLSTTAISKQL